MSHNSDYYRYYHHRHHRFTQDHANDPELLRPKPRTVAEYGLRLSGLLFWRDKIQDMYVVSTGHLVHLPCVPEPVRLRLRSMQAQVGFYGLIAISVLGLRAVRHPSHLADPSIARPVACAARSPPGREHTGCRENAQRFHQHAHDSDSRPIRLLMKKAGYHAEHHLYPSIFFSMPCHRSRGVIHTRLAHLDTGYIAVDQYR